jgi:hypothetical protein
MTTSGYPDGYEPRLFLAKACEELGAVVTYDSPTISSEENPEKRTVPGFTVNGRTVIYLLDNRMPDLQEQNRDAEALRVMDNALVCCAQKTDAEEHGFYWLPLAMTPDYAPKEIISMDEVEEMGGRPSLLWDSTWFRAERKQFAFVGYLNDLPRKSLMERLQDRYSGHVVSGVFGDVAIAVYQEGKVGLNITAFYGSVFAYDINMRVFEIPGTMRPLLTPYVPGMTELGFRHAENCMMYSNADELCAHMDTLLGNDFICERLAWHGAKLVIGNHRYHHRAEQLLKLLEDNP